MWLEGGHAVGIPLSVRKWKPLAKKKPDSGIPTARRRIFSWEDGRPLFLRLSLDGHVSGSACSPQLSRPQTDENLVFVEKFVVRHLVIFFQSSCHLEDGKRLLMAAEG